MLPMRGGRPTNRWEDGTTEATDAGWLSFAIDD